MPSQMYHERSAALHNSITVAYMEDVALVSLRGATDIVRTGEMTSNTVLRDPIVLRGTAQVTGM
jgi:hypothetical protein